MAQKNKNLHAAKAAKNDEFYTQYNDIAEELKHYTKHFEGKTVFCNCDDPEWSKFWQYFVAKFESLKLKKLISTHYNMDGSPSYALTFEGQYGEDGKEITNRIELKGNGDFRSEECIEFLKEADIVCTNPMFSLFKEYIVQLTEYNKKFLIIGNKNAITYKEVFTLLKDDRIWLGYTTPSEFVLPNGELTKKVSGLCRWFTNLDNDVRHRKLILLQDYNIEDYPVYDNYNAREVSKVKDIPEGYNGVMGVPITFIDKYCPEQFEIIGATESEGKGFSNGLWKPDSKVAQPLVNNKRVYKRLFIRSKGDV